MAQILLVGSELPLLEGLSQSFAALGFAPQVAQSLHEAREVASSHSAAPSRSSAVGWPPSRAPTR